VSIVLAAVAEEEAPDDRRCCSSRNAANFFDLDDPRFRLGVCVGDIMNVALLVLCSGGSDCFLCWESRGDEKLSGNRAGIEEAEEEDSVDGRLPRDCRYGDLLPADEEEEEEEATPADSAAVNEVNGSRAMPLSSLSPWCWWLLAWD